MFSVARAWATIPLWSTADSSLHLRQCQPYLWGYDHEKFSSKIIIIIIIIFLSYEWSYAHRKYCETDLVNAVTSAVTKFYRQGYSLQWRHNEPDGVSNHQPPDCLLNRLFRHRWKKTSKLRVTGVCAENSPVTGEFPAQRASNAENVSIC